MAANVASEGSALQPTGLQANELACVLEGYLAAHPGAAVLDEGHLVFEMPRTSYSLSSEHNRCVLQLWSSERNLIRTVIGVSNRKDTLNVQVRRFGRSEPQMMQFIPDRDTRSSGIRSTMRSRFLRALEVVIGRDWSEWKLTGLRSAMDLEHSFGPAYGRGLLTQGQSAWAVIAVSGDEMPSTIDGILTVGILWLHQCREQQQGRRVVQGLRLILPAGHSEVTASRVPWLHADLAKWEVWELEPHGDRLMRLETSRQGNLKVRLVRAFDAASSVARYQAGVQQILALVPEDRRSLVETRARSATEVTVSLHGLEFARIRHGHARDTFARQDVITFGAGANETPLNEDTEPMLRELVQRLFASRTAMRTDEPAARDALYRLQPERWLESVLRQELSEIEPSLNTQNVYSQVPAFAASDRGMLDLLTVDRTGRLAVLELKADDDLQLPLQGLDYWLRVHQLHQQRSPSTGNSELERMGYFPRMVLSTDPPLLYFVAPALRIHPANETVLKYFAEEVEWTFIALNEDWRTERKVIFRKHARPV